MKLEFVEPRVETFVFAPEDICTNSGVDQDQYGPLFSEDIFWNDED